MGAPTLPGSKGPDLKYLGPLIEFSQVLFDAEQRGRKSQVEDFLRCCPFTCCLALPYAYRKGAVVLALPAAVALELAISK